MTSNRRPKCQTPNVPKISLDTIRQASERALNAARDEEAQACAKIAEERTTRCLLENGYDIGFVDAAKFIRDAIRQRIKDRADSHESIEKQS